MIGRLENGNMIPCPKSGTDGNGILHTNLPAYYEKHLDIAAADGYYPVRYTEKPEGNYIYSWELQSGVIVQVWSPYEPQPEPPYVDTIKLRADVDYIAMMTDVDLDGDL